MIHELDEAISTRERFRELTRDTGKIMAAATEKSLNATGRRFIAASPFDEEASCNQQV